MPAGRLRGCLIWCLPGNRTDTAVVLNRRHQKARSRFLRRPDQNSQSRNQTAHIGRLADRKTVQVRQHDVQDHQIHGIVFSTISASALSSAVKQLWLPCRI